jgi:hypothetical protein
MVVYNVLDAEEESADGDASIPLYSNSLVYDF